ncbi:methyltransferase domain-containing protein [Pseudogulbenkiania ferrooxidans]|uniref:Methyltransferase type 12 n=1 Tax=Pseudogulbenkiania ferrooxidans 2002 TaxID=279714 RepID=B9Z0Z2_9NEIS|nr:hypothetical protein [Pseudogulbenkiania ferrooxidans]EEG09748.1 conserved hypothetical protein [Pseudogulbenkiania ferrooxidans 2002]
MSRAVFVALLRHGLLQLAAALGAWFLIAPALQPLAWSVLQGLLAAALAALLRLRRGSWLAHGLFAPAVVYCYQLALPAWAYLLALLLTFAIGRNAWLERVPFYRSSPRVVERLAEALPEQARLLEAGCGDAKLALQLAERRPDLQIAALETAWAAWALAWLRWCLAGRPANVRIACRSLWLEPLSEYDAVYAFLSPQPMPRLWRKFVTEGQPGSLLLSNTFTVPGVEPERSLALGGPLQKQLLIWRHPHGTR